MESVVLDLAGHRRSRHPGTGDLGVANLRSSVYAQPGAGRSAYVARGREATPSQARRRARSNATPAGVDSLSHAGLRRRSM